MNLRPGDLVTWKDMLINGFHDFQPPIWNNGDNGTSRVVTIEKGALISVVAVQQHTELRSTFVYVLPFHGWMNVNLFQRVKP